VVSSFRTPHQTLFSAELRGQRISRFSSGSTSCLELTYTCWSLAAFAEDQATLAPLSLGRRATNVIKAELNAAFFHIFGVGREDVEHVLDSFRARS